MKKNILLVIFTIALLFPGNITYCIHLPIDMSIEDWENNGGTKFGEKPFIGSYAEQIHLGVDIGAPAKTPVLAIADGIVKHKHYYAGPLNYGGIYIVEHKIGGETVCAVYAHLNFESFTKAEGQQVKEGDPLGIIGTKEQNGGWDYEHLHFGIRPGVYRYPWDYISVHDPVTGWRNDWVYLGYTLNANEGANNHNLTYLYSHEVMRDRWYNPTQFIRKYLVGFTVHDSIQIVRYWGRTMCSDNDLYLGSTGPWTTPYDWNIGYREGDFRSTYRILNTGSQTIFIDHLVLSVYKSNGDFFRYMNEIGSSSPKYVHDLNMKVGDEYKFDEAWTSFNQDETGEYRIVAEAFIGGKKYQLQTKDYLSLDKDQVGVTLTVRNSPILLKTFLSSNQNVDGVWTLKAADNSGETGRFEAAYELHNITSAPVHISELTLATLKETIFHNMKIPGTDQYSITNIDIEPGGSFSFPPPSTPPASYSSTTVYPWEVLDKTANTNDFAYYNFSQSETGDYKVIPKITFNGQTYNMGYQDLKVINSQNITSIKITGWSVVSENSGAQYTCTAYHSDGSTTDVTGAAGWTLLGAINASLNNSGYLTTYEVSANDDCRIRASYGGMYDLFNVTIENSGSNLQAPYNLNASKGTYSDHIQISWSISANTDKVSIDRKKDDESWTGLGWTDTLTSHTDNDFLQTGSIYYYRVRAHNSTTGDVSVYSNEDSGFLKEPGADEKTPQNVNATNDHAHYIQLTCDWIANIEGWKVYRSESPNGTYALIKTYDNNQGFVYNDYSPEPEIYYYYKLTSYGSFGESPASSPVGGSKLLYIGGISPTGGSPGDTVTIINSESPPEYPLGLGANQGTVYFGSTPAVVNSWSNNQVTAKVPEGSGTVEVTVSSPAGIPSINSKTFTYDSPPTLVNVSITGPLEVEENSGAQYNCIAYYSDGSSTNVSGGVTWSVNSSYAAINNSGYLTTSSIPSDQPCRVSVTYTEGNVTKTSYLDITLFLPSTPSINIIEPDGINDTADQTYTITWTDSDPDNNAVISLYYDTNNNGADGTLIIGGLTEDSTTDSYTWDTSSLPAGDYYVYGVIDDGVNEAVIDYSQGMVTIGHSTLNNGLVAYYPFDNDIIDASGNNYSGRITGSLSYERGVIGQAVRFDGSSYILIDNLFFPIGTGTISLWAKVDNNSSPGSLLDSKTNYRSAFYHNSIEFCIGYPRVPLVTDQWKFYTFVYQNGTSSSGIRQSYVNGVLAATNTGYVNNFQMPWNGTIDAESAIGISIWNGNIFKGVIDDIRIYNHVLTDAEIQALYGLGSIPPVDPLDNDDDNDGYTENQGDCRDDDETIYPGAPEVRGDGIDQDCNGEDLSCLEAGYLNQSEQKILASEGDPELSFGRGISISGNYAIVGAWGDTENGWNAGAAYIFERSGDTWSEVTKLTASDGAAWDNFGYSVSISDNYAVVGAWRDEDNGEMSGSAYVFERINGAWTQVAKLVPGEGSEQDRFGWSVSISGNYIIIGAFGNSTVSYSGSAYIYERINGFWTQVSKLTANDPSAGYFGYAVSISGDSAVSTAISENPRAAAYVFKRENGVWTKIQKLTSNLTSDNFGESVMISDNRIVVGANYGLETDYKGSAYVFERNGETWTSTYISTNDCAAYDYFGTSVAIYGNHIFIGAPGDDDHGETSGSIYIFEYNNLNWRQISKVTSSNSKANDNYGYFLAASGDFLLVSSYANDDNGINAGAVYAYKLDCFDNTHPITIKVTSPNGGEYLEAGSSQNITWTTESLTGNVTIDLYKGGTLDSNIGTADVHSSPFPWTINPNQEEGSDYTVKIYQGTVEDFSDNPFTISPPPIEEPEINITHGTIEIPDGGSFNFGDVSVGNSIDEAFTIENTGNADLILSNLPISITGPHADRFSVIQQPITPIASSGTSTFIIRFAPSPEGAQTAAISIGNNDSDEAPYDIILNGTGTENIIPALERSALIAVYESTDGNNWTNNSGWKTEPLYTDGFAMPGTEGTWFGVTLSNSNGQNHVTQIELSSNNLLGNIPVEIGNLSYLATITLFNNKLSGSIPTGFGDLSNLKNLDLGLNSFDPGSIPGWITTLSQLERIRLDSINLNGPIPPELGQLSHLISLNLSNNFLSGSIPLSLGNLSELEDLLLYSNNLEGGIPDELANLTKLKNLDLESNQLSGGFPGWVVNLTDLWNLNLGGCGLTGSIPIEIENLTNLITLVLSDNQLTGSIPPEIGNLPELNYLSLSNNNLSGSIPTEFENLHNLQILYLHSNQLSGNIPKELGSLSSLTNLYLGDNSFSGNGPEELDNLSNLNNLTLQSNMFIGNIPNNFTNLVNLTYLDLGYNALHTDDINLRTFLNEKDPDWENTQTIAPANVMATVLSSSSIQVSWTPITYSEGAGSYKILYGETPGDPYPYEYGATIDKTASSLAVSGLAPGATYYIVVQTRTEPHANNQNAVESEQSAEVIATTPICTMLIISPNGGENWMVASIQGICWLSTGIVNNVKIDYSIDNGISWIEIESAIENVGSYSWTVPDNLTNQCLIRVSEVNGNCSDTGDSIFSIVPNPTLTITTPNGGGNWQIGSTQSITWLTTGSVGNVKIEYSADNGSTWAEIESSTINSGIYSWTIPDTPSTQCLVRISDIDGSLTDTSDTVFAIVYPTIPSIERNALIAIYNNANGDNWTNNSGWKTPPLHTDGFALPGTEGTWYGITVVNDNGEAHVTGITLGFNDLSGNIPQGIGNLSYVKHFILPGNKLSGIIPAEIGNLINMNSFQVSGNKLTGAIPSTLKNLTVLAPTGTDIGYNALYTTDETLRSFLNGKDPDWEDTQTTFPSTVSAVTLLNRSIQVDWTPIKYTNDTGSYKVLYSTTPGGPYSYETAPTTDKIASSLTITGLLPGATYYFVVQTRTEPHTFNQNTVTGDYSSEISAATLPEIIVNSPNGGENWEAGSIHPIAWTSFGASQKVIIAYSINNGASWKNITPSTANDGLFNWQIPNTPSTNCLISISGSDSDKGPYDISNAVFSIIAPSSPTIFVQSPNGGEKLIVGSTKIIKWTTTGTVGDVKIECSTDNGNSWTGIITSTSNSGSYPWTIPNIPSNSCLVRVSETDGEPMDTSDLEFSIEPPPPPVITVTSPNGGEDIITGSTHEITWTSTESNWEAKLEYSIDNGTSWVTIILCTPNDGSYMWTVPNTPSDTCLVKISRFDTDEGPMDTGDAVFSIKQGQFLKLTAPNGNEILEPGKNFLIKWESDPVIENIKLGYSPDNGSIYLPIADRIVNTGNYEWPVPYHISTNCLVRVSNADGIRPAPQSLVYELKLKIQTANFPVTDNDIFTMWLGDLSKLNETVTHFTPQITITRESNGSYYIRMDETIKEIQPLSEGWRRLKVFLDMETQLASLWLDDTVIFENLPLKPGINFVPAVSFSIGAENPLAVEIDDLSLQLLTLTNGEDVFSTVFAEDFENFEEAKFPNNSGWQSTLIEGRKKDRSTSPEKIEQSVFVYRDFASGEKCLKIQFVEDSQLIVVKPFNIPESYPFDISDKKFSIISDEGVIFSPAP